MDKQQPKSSPPRPPDGAQTEHESAACVVVGEADRVAALQRLMPDSGHAEQFVAYANANQVPLEALWGLRDAEGGFRHAVLAVPSPGRTAVLFASPAGANAGSGVSELAGLIDYACGGRGGRGGLAERDIHLAQCLLEVRDDTQAAAFRGGGFTDLATLQYLELPLNRTKAAPPPAFPPGVTVEQYDQSKRADVLAVLEGSYRDTLDCPGLRGLRDTEDILTGHMSAGTFDPDLWTILRIDGRAEGLLLLNPSPASNTIELVYVGLTCAARGRGLGRELLHSGWKRLAGRRERAVTLAVDERNVPARKLYEREGFGVALRRHALIRSLRGDRSA